jgi:hypothetical protein
MMQPFLLQSGNGGKATEFPEVLNNHDGARPLAYLRNARTAA